MVRTGTPEAGAWYSSAKRIILRYLSTNHSVAGFLQSIYGPGKSQNYPGAWRIRPIPDTARSNGSGTADQLYALDRTSKDQAKNGSTAGPNAIRTSGSASNHQ